MFYRVGNALSQAVAVCSLSMQIDAVMDSDMNTDRAVDQLAFGLMACLEDVGKIAFVHLKREDTLKSMTVVTQEAVGAIPAMYWVDHNTSMKSVV